MSEKKSYRTGICVTSGFFAGVALGIISGIMEGDFGLWLTVGVGTGIALAAAIGVMLEFK